MNKTGQSLVEILIVVVILSLALIPLFSMFIYGTTETAETLNKTIATTLAVEAIEVIKTIPYDVLISNPACPVPELGSFDSKFDREISIIPRISDNIVEIKVAVRWKEETEKRPGEVLLMTLVTNPRLIQ